MDGGIDVEAVLALLATKVLSVENEYWNGYEKEYVPAYSSGRSLRWKKLECIPGINTRIANE